ncbi:MAG: hypothetical protein H6704_12655 [Myxococcales bacterium]|nr:hypothetical protein [Myxococcales bacterium]
MPQLLVVVFIMLAAGAAHADRVITIQPQATGVLCAQHTGRGDRDFYGNGPEVEASATLIVDRDGRRLRARLTMFARETSPDWTTADGIQDFVVWTAPEGMTLVGVEGSNRAYVSYTDVDHEQDVLPGTGPVRQFQLTGDTDGEDLTGPCSNRRTSVQVLFERVQLRVRDEAAGCPRRLVQAYLRNPGMFCPTWRNHGDGDFYGNGPQISAAAVLDIGPDDRTLQMSLTWEAQENPWYGERIRYYYWGRTYTPPSDTVMGSHGGIDVWTAPAGCRIHEIRSGRRSAGGQIDDDHDVNVVFDRRGGFVHSFRLMGDRDGTDIADPPTQCTPGEMHSVGVQAFRPVTVVVGP